ncbi:hypothetical protein ACH5RR_000554 [Cinchona calisaya]|uniref:DUF4371 domain-containing protein n=1 Tax=Cinchona calisaya TaxID=153742 RepID=A0ABD3B131_9GENT
MNLDPCTIAASRMNSLVQLEATSASNIFHIMFDEATNSPQSNFTNGVVILNNQGGDINRMKQHLGRDKGSVVSCTKVNPEVRNAILGSLKETAQKAKENRGDFGEENPFGRFMNEYDSDEVQEIPHLQAKGVSFNKLETSTNKGKRKAITSTSAYFKGGRDGSQPTIKAFNSPFYQNSIDHIAAIGHRYKGSFYHAIQSLCCEMLRKNYN